MNTPNRPVPVDAATSSADAAPPVESSTAGTNQRDAATLVRDAASNAAGQSTAVVEHMWDEMRDRWQRGQRVLADEYLQSVGKLSDEAAVDLIYAEFALRREHGETPSIKEYVDRFPQFAQAIQRQFSLHEQLDPVPDYKLADAQSDDQFVDDLRGALWIARAHDSARAANPLANQTFPITFGKYALLALLDSGGQGAVFHAIHMTLRKDVVVKLSNRSLDERSPIATQLMEEGRILAEVDHPAMARVYDLGVYEGRPFLVMEYIRGTSLNRFAADHKISPYHAARLVAGIARAVDAAHRRQVLHLDIKPKNIVIDEHGAPRLIDFGLSQLRTAWGGDTQERGLSGTLQFMAPEQGRADPNIGPTADVFALGGVLYFLLTGLVPFPGNDAPDVLSRVVAGNWDRSQLDRDTIPRRLRAICTRAMASNPAARYPSAAALADALEAAIAAPRRKLISIAVVALLVLAAALGVWRMRSSGTDSAVSLATPLQLVPHVRQGKRFAPLPDALPLQSGDELFLRAEIPAGVHASLHLFSEGAWRQLAAWPAAPHARQVRFPDAEGATVPLEGKPGTELLVLCVDDDGSPPTDLIQELAALKEPLPDLPRYSIATVDSAGVRVEAHSRGFGSVIQRHDPAATLSERLHSVAGAFTRHGLSFTGLAFSHN